MKCPVCNTDNGSDISFCQGCGRKIPRCPTCGIELTTRDRFCSADGTRLSDDLLLLVPEEAILAAPVWTQAGGNKPADPVQQTWTEAFPEDTVRSTGSGNASAFTDWEEKPVVSEMPKRAFCEKCGKRIAPGTRYCGDCDPTRRRTRDRGGNSRMKIILIIMLILLLLAGLCAGGYALINSDLFDWDSTSSNRAEKEEDEDEEETGDTEDTGSGNAEVLPTQGPSEELPTTGIEDPVTTQPPTEPVTQPPVVETQPPQTPLNYWIENCDKTYLRESDLEGFDKQMCVYARNAIYAKSGRMFKSQDLQRYFSQFSWYNPIVSPDRFTDSMLNSYQIANLNVILAYERAHGYN